MGEDRRQGDRRQSQVVDRRETTTEGLAKKTISLQTFIVIIAIVAVTMLGILWFIINNNTSNEYEDDEIVYEDTDDDYTYEDNEDTVEAEETQDTEDIEDTDNVDETENVTEDTAENTTENVAQ